MALNADCGISISEFGFVLWEANFGILIGFASYDAVKQNDYLYLNYENCACS